jgi:hypothetical protein
MPEQFDYPKDGWSTGKMRRNGDSPTMQDMRDIAESPDIGRAAAAFADNPALKTIEKLFKGQKLAQGQYDTKLSEAEEVAFQKWKKQHAPKDSGLDYDLRGAFKSGFKPDEAGHWPDLYKKPNHPTFSDQSIYAKEGNPGRWEGENFIPPGG